MSVTAGASPIIWMSNDGDVVISKVGESYHFRDKSGTLLDMGNSLVMLKEMLEQIGRHDVVSELIKAGII
ncbi:hypothetical protein [Anaerospora hongkongensis]|uniref:hypothetical protein n=1 Tax=Anaerospora hongkongensis TaxID=244830 RepID=UPI00289DA9F9|nr:hypothetical protein [Anaerospora hongkongensis]